MCTSNESKEHYSHFVEIEIFCCVHHFGGLLQLYDPPKKQPFTDRVTDYATEMPGALRGALLIRQNIRGSQYINALSTGSNSARLR